MGPVVVGERGRTPRIIARERGDRAAVSEIDHLEQPVPAARATQSSVRRHGNGTEVVGVGARGPPSLALGQVSRLEIAAELQLPLSTVVQVQRRLGWRRLPPLTPKPAAHRYGRRVPGAMVHLDIKKLGRIGNVCWAERELRQHVRVSGRSSCF
jgi:hypothetical protein